MSCLLVWWWGCTGGYRKPLKASALRIDSSHSFCCWQKYAQLLETCLPLKIPATCETVSHRQCHWRSDVRKEQMKNAKFKYPDFWVSSYKSPVIPSFNTCLKQVPNIYLSVGQSLLFPFLFSIKKKKKSVCCAEIIQAGIDLRFGKSEQNTSVLLPVSLHWFTKELKTPVELCVDWVLYNNDKGAEIRLEEIFPIKMQD